MPCSGNLQSFPSAAKESSFAYDFSIARYLEKYHKTYPGKLLLTASPFSDHLEDIGFTVFADDVCRTTASPGKEASAVALRSNIQGKWMAEEMEVEGYALNTEKK